MGANEDASILHRRESVALLSRTTWAAEIIVVYSQELKYALAVQPVHSRSLGWSRPTILRSKATIPCSPPPIPNISPSFPTHPLWAFCLSKLSSYCTGRHYASPSTQPQERLRGTSQQKRGWKQAGTKRPSVARTEGRRPRDTLASHVLPKLSTSTRRRGHSTPHHIGRQSP